MAPTRSKTNTTTRLEKTDRELAAGVLHLKKLLQARNWLRSPLLRLPTEVIVHILSYIMVETVHSSVWQPITRTCHHIRKVMCTSTELWRWADFKSDRLATLAFERSQGNLEAIFTDLEPAGGDWVNQNNWRFCRDNLALHGHKLHTLDLCGYPFHLADFSWIFERPLPRLERLKIHLEPEWQEGNGSFLWDPVVLQLPTNLPLRVLHLCNAILPWSSGLFAGLSELHLDFRGCQGFVEISEEDMLGVFEASPQLETLSLFQLLSKVDPVRGYVPTRTVKFTNLKHLVLDSFARLVAYMLDHMDTPAIEQLKIRGELSSWEVEGSLDYFFSDTCLPDRLFPNPPTFEVWPDCGEGIYNSLKINIGNCHIQFDFDMDETEMTSDIIMACILPFVPPSVTTLRLDYSRLDEDAEWAEFFLSHSEVRSIECLDSGPVDESLWDALSPVKMGGLILCPKLESITLNKKGMSAPLLTCLMERKAVGFGLKRLGLHAADDGMVQASVALVEEVQAVNTPTTKPVRSVLDGQSDNHG